jgi:SAM-dependent methyltransferase
MIDAGNVKRFWEARGSKLGEVPFESIANLEEDPKLLELKVKLEQERVLPLLPLGPERALLDLGAGVGQWTFRFAPLVRRVVAVEYSAPLAEIGRKEAARRGAHNVEFVVSAAEAYETSERFDVVFVSGLFVYLTDAQCERLMASLPRLLAPGGTLLLRDGTSVLPGRRHEIDHRFSQHLREYYSAVYRTRDEYLELFARAGFALTSDGQMFDESNPLNKYPETRLRYYVFRAEPPACP